MRDASLLTTSQVARKMSVSQTTVRRLCNDGSLKSFRLASGHRRVKRADLAAFMREHGIPENR
jgi:excisionase family DNA binding protein